MIDTQQVGKTIATLRNKKNLSQQALANLCSVTHQAVSKWENGMALPDMQTMLFLSKFFGTSMEDILTGNLSEAENSIPEEKEAPNNPPAEQEDEADKPQEKHSPENDSPLLDWNDIMNLAPFASRDTLNQLVEQELKRGNAAAWHHIMGLIPFLSRDTVGKLFHACLEPLNIHQLAGLAPFMHRETLANALRSLPEGKEKRQAMMSMLPFLPKEMIDEMLLNQPMAPKGPAPSSHQGERALMRIARKAVADDNETWLSDHVEDLTEEELDLLIDPLSDHGKWNVLTEMAEHMNSNSLLHLAQKGISHQQWEFLAEIAEHADGPVLQAIIQGAIDQQQWEQLENLAEYADDFIDLIASAAIRAQQWPFLEEILDDLSLEMLQQVLDAAIQHSAWELIDEISEHLS